MSFLFDPNCGQSSGLNAGNLAFFSAENIRYYNKGQVPEKLNRNSQGLLQKRPTLQRPILFSPRLSVDPLTVVNGNTVLSPEELINGFLHDTTGNLPVNGNSSNYTLPPISDLLKFLNLSSFPKAPTYINNQNRSYVRAMWTFTIFRQNDARFVAPAASPFLGHGGNSGYSSISVRDGVVTDLPPAANVRVKETNTTPGTGSNDSQQKVYFFVLQNSDSQVPTVAFFSQ